MIRAPKGKLLLSCDLSQAEAWVVAYLCFDEKMKVALRSGDIHSLTGCTLFDIPYDSIEETKTLADRKLITKEQRYTGKKCNHAFNYRMGPERATQVINKEGIITITVKDAKRYHTRYHEFYNLKGWWRDIEESLRATHTLRTPYGRVRRFYGMLDDKTLKEATAFVPQSTIADHMLGAVQKENPVAGGLLEVHRRIILPSKGEVCAINTSHDSVILEVPESRVDEIAQHTITLLKRPLVINDEEFTVPVDAEVGERWGEFEKLKVA